MRRIAAVARKEALHIARDPRSLAVAVAMPVLLVIVYGAAINLELRDLPLGVLDLDRTPASRDLVRHLTSSGFIVDAGRLSGRAEIEPGFRRGRFRAVLVIPRGYQADNIDAPTATVQLLIDAADAATAATVDNYLRAALALVNARQQTAAATKVGRSGAASPYDLQVRYLYNEELASANFIVPGLVAIILVMICALLTSLAVTRERETGTLEQILTTPVAAGQVITGKLLPYLVVGAVDAALVLLSGRVLFDVPMRGSWLALAGYILLYILIALSLGLLISTLARTQRVAMMMALFITLLPTLLLSGFIFEIASMPRPLQWVAHLVPATYFLTIIRGLMLAGVNWHPLAGGVMLGMAALLLVGATRRFRVGLE